MPKLKPSIRPSETYTEPNFLRVITAAPSRAPRASRPSSTVLPAEGRRAKPGWKCATIVDGEAMSKEDAMFIARNYAVENDVPVIYECHSE